MNVSWHWGKISDNIHMDTEHGNMKMNVPAERHHRFTQATCPQAVLHTIHNAYCFVRGRFNGSLNWYSHRNHERRCAHLWNQPTRRDHWRPIGPQSSPLHEASLTSKHSSYWNISTTTFHDHLIVLQTLMSDLQNDKVNMFHTSEPSQWNNIDTVNTPCLNNKYKSSAVVN